MIRLTLITILLLLNQNVLFAQRRHTERGYEVFGLPDGDKIGESLMIALPLLVIGFLIAYGFMWSKKDTEKVSDYSTNIGCLGVIIMAIGAFFLIPLLSWIEFFLVSIWSIGTVVIIVGLILYLIYSVIKK